MFPVAELDELERANGRVVHDCPPVGASATPCCGKTPFDLPRWHRMTLDPALVTCGQPTTEGR